MRPKKKVHNRKENKSFNNNSNETKRNSQQDGQTISSSKPYVADVTKDIKSQIQVVDVVSAKPLLLPPDTINESSKYNVQKYRKREIKSNWDRYDLPEEVEENNDDRNLTVQSPTTPRGYDFSFLQTVGGGVGSQFRFQDEKDWAEESESTSESLIQFQLLDIQDLATSLSCIPIQKRLSIEADYFTHEQLLEFERAAVESQGIYQQLYSTKTAELKHAPNSADINKPHNAEESLSRILENNNQSEKTELSSYQNETLLTVGNTDILNDTVIPDIENMSRKIHEETIDKNESEDELDALLKCNAISKQSCSIDIKPLLTCQLDLDSNTPSSKQSMKMPTISDLPNQKTEDWLDEFFKE